MIARRLALTLNSHSMALTYCVNFEFTTLTLLIVHYVHSTTLPSLRYGHCSLRSQPRGPQLLTQFYKQKFFSKTSLFHFSILYSLHALALAPVLLFCNRVNCASLYRHVSSYISHFVTISFTNRFMASSVFRRGTRTLMNNPSSSPQSPCPNMRLSLQSRHLILLNSRTIKK